MQLPQPEDPRKPRPYVEHDGYQVQHLPEMSPDPAEGLRAFNFVVKRSYAIVPDAPAQPARLQRPIVMADVFHDGVLDPIRGSIRYESELMPPKPACDVVVNGHCYPPGGEATTVECGVRVGDHAKRALVIGDRSVWKPRGSSRVQMSPARPFSVVALRWENAYGGVDGTPVGPVPHPANPAGKGYFTRPLDASQERDLYGPLPNIEDPKRPLALDALEVDMADWRAGPRPVGFGWVPKHWAPRNELAGLPPELRPVWDLFHKNPPPGAAKALPFRELQPGFLNGAPEGQVIPHPRGGELVVLDHLHPSQAQLRFRLPADHPRLRWDCGAGGFVDVKLRIDTVLIEPDVMTLDVVWRGRVPSPEGFRLDQLGIVRIEVDGELTVPAVLLDTAFPPHLLTEGKP
jgi:hypothetical protein